MNWEATDYGYKAKALGGTFTLTRTPGRRFVLDFDGPAPPVDPTWPGARSLTACKAEAERFVAACLAQTTPIDLPPPPEPDAEPVDEPTPLESAPEVQPAGDPDLDIDHVAEPMPVYAPAPTVPPPMSEPEPAPRPDTGVVDRDSVDATLNRLVMYRDLKWLPRARTRPVKRYADVRA